METVFPQLGISDFWFKVLKTCAICILMGLVIQSIVFSILKICNRKIRIEDKKALDNMAWFG